MNRRQFVAAAAVGVAGVSAGCVSDILNDVTSFEASPIRVSADAADDAGYEYRGTEERVEEREFGGENVETTNYISQYVRTIDVPFAGLSSEVDAGVFALVSTPQVAVAGESFNPVGDMSEAELAEYVQEEYDELEIDSNVGGRAIEAEELESTLSLETYDGTATLQGETGVDVYVDVAQLSYDEDHLVVIGVYPDDDDVPLDDERERVDTMVAGIEHGDDVEVDIVESDADGHDTESDDGGEDDAETDDSDGNDDEADDADEDDAGADDTDEDDADEDGEDE
ncbi:DUF6517 family protein [Natronorubrum texcoconense]